MKTSDRAALIAVSHGVAPHRTLTPAEQAIWDEAQACVTAIAEAQLRNVPPPKPIDDVIREIAELPDRSSPEGWPEAMLVTADELRDILRA